MLFTSPLTLTDGVTPVIFTFMNQEKLNGSFVGTYKALDLPIDHAVKVVVKQKTGNAAKSNALLKITRKYEVTDESTGLTTLKMSDWNLTYAGSTAIPEADIQADLDLLLNAAAQANFVRYFRNGAV